MGKLDVVVGGQFGSEAKGAVCARLVRIALRDGTRADDIAVVRVAGHNAGHTAYDGDGRAWALRTVPAAAVVNPDILLVIAAGSEVNPDVLKYEVETLEAAGIPVRHRLFVDVSATWLTDEHIAAENGAQMHEKTGSTAKGVGAARAARAMRKAFQIGDWDDLTKYAIPFEDTGKMLRRLVADEASYVLIEGTQGFGLGLHTQHYPLVTSSDCRAIDFLAMAGIDPTASNDYHVWVVLRRFPIRVAGPSGDLQNETTWEELGLPEEKTTVTKKVRRVGQWDAKIASDAVEANGGPRIVRIAYTMADQSNKALAGLDEPMEALLADDPESELFAAFEAEALRVREATGLIPSLYGTGPNTMVEAFR